MYEVPITFKAWCHGCKEIRSYVELKCTTCGKRKPIVELLCTYSESEGVISLPNGH